MKLKKKIMIIIVIIICILIFVICLFNGKMKYNNEQNYQELITYRFSSDKFSDIQEYIKSENDVKLFEIALSKKIECIRDIEDIGYRYVLLLSEKDEKLFIFFDSDNVVLDTYYVENDFLEQSDFSNVQEGITRLSDIEILDGSLIVYPVSVIMVTGHIVNEGIFIITYDRFLDGELINDPVVKSIDFYSNDEILSMMESNIFVSGTPYILPIDKQ